MIVTIEITDVQPQGDTIAFKSEITDKGVKDIEGWRLVFTALVCRLKDLGVTEEQLVGSVTNSGESFDISDKEMIADKQMLIDAIRGREPSYEQMDHPLCKANGDYSGGFSDRWTWDRYKLMALTEDTLVQLYRHLRN